MKITLFNIAIDISLLEIIFTDGMWDFTLLRFMVSYEDGEGSGWLKMGSLLSLGHLAAIEDSEGEICGAESHVEALFIRLYQSIN